MYYSKLEILDSFVSLTFGRGINGGKAHEVLSVEFT
jgi:hypothetical protein